MGYLYNFQSKSSVLLSSGESCYCLTDQHRWHKRQPRSSVEDMYAVDLFPPCSLSTPYSALFSLDISVHRLSLCKQIYRPRSDITSHSLTMYFFKFRPQIYSLVRAANIHVYFMIFRILTAASFS